MHSESIGNLKLMKKLVLLTIVPLLVSCVLTHETESAYVENIPVNSGNSVPVTINWSHTGLIEGYDHPNRIQVYIDGKSVGISGIIEQSDSGKYEISVSPGEHLLKIEVYVYYKGWELESKANEYAVDAVYEKVMDFRSPVSVNMVMDIADGTTGVETDE